MKKTILATSILLAFASPNVFALATQGQDLVHTNGQIKESVNSTEGHKLEVKADKISIETGLRGVQAANNSTVIVGTNSTQSTNILVDKQNTNKNNAIGILSIGNSTVSVLGKMVTVSTNNAKTDVKAIGMQVGSGGSLTLGNANTDKLQVTARGGSTAVALETIDKAKANLEAKEIVVISDGQGLQVSNNTQTPTAPENRSTVIVRADNITIQAKTQGLAVYSNGLMNINGNLTLDAGQGQAIEARGHSTVNINTDGLHTTKIKGDIVFGTPGPASQSGDILDADVNINLTGASSYWEGNTYRTYPTDFKNFENYEQVVKVDGLNVTLAQGAQWTPTTINPSQSEDVVDQQNVNQLTLNAGVVKVADNINVTVDTLKGKGEICLGTDGKTSGTFNVGTAEEGTSLAVALMDPSMSRKLTSDEVSAEEALALKQNVGKNEQGQNVVKTTVDVKEGDYKPGYAIDAQGNTTTAPVNTLMQSSLELASAAPLAINRILMNDVRKRLGDIRSAEGKSGAWVRYDGGRLSGSNGLENDFHTIQVGVDTQPTNDPVRFGVAFSYTNSDTDYARGSADMDAYTLAGYGLWLGENGQFVDVIARMASTKTDMTVDGEKAGKMDNIALSLSGEFGWRFDLANNFFVEPQVEGTYTYVEADNLTLSNGSTYAYDAVDSFLGRAGVAFGMQCPNNKGNVYAHVSAVHEFLGDKAVTGGDGTVYSLDGKDTWVEYGLGANFNVTPNTYLWADLERTSGGTLDEDYRATFGVRYSW